MKKTLAFATIAVPLLLVSSAEAMTLTVNWGTTRSYSVSADLSGVYDGVFSTKGFALGTVTGTVDKNLPTERNLGRIFCIDFMNTAPNNGTWNVVERSTGDATSFTSNDSHPTYPGWGDASAGYNEDEFRDQGSLGQAAWLADTYAGQATSYTQVLGLNFAIYKAVYGARLQLGTFTGGFIGNTNYTGDDELYWANEYWGGLLAASGTSGRGTWYDNDLMTTQFQDFLRPVPEPMSLGILGLGLLGFGLSRRRHS